MTLSILDPQRHATVHRHGAEAQPVIVIDDLLAKPSAWREAAAKAAWGVHGPHYPGPRAPVDRSAAEALRAELAPLVTDVFGLAPPLLECWFSIVATPPAQLRPIQRLPHFDGLERERIAILVFLSGEAQGGTAFYRHRNTGFETVDDARFPAFDARLRADVLARGLPSARYIAGDTPLYEQIALYPARLNRALIYRGHTLHCAAIPPETPLSSDPSSGRLTINAFLFD